MSFEFFIGRRHLRSRKGQTFVSLITWLSTIGVAVGVMVMIVVIAVMSGAELELRNRMLNVTAHAVIMRYGAPFVSYTPVLEKVRKAPDILAATPYIYTQAMLRSSKGVTGAVLRGVEPKTAGKVIPSLDIKGLKRLDASGKNDPASKVPMIPGIILGTELAEILKVKTGDMISLVLPRSGSGGAKGMMPVTRRLKVAGLFESGLYEFDKAMSFISLDLAQEMLKQPDRISGIEIRVADPFLARTIAARVAAELDRPFWFQDWMRTNQNIFSALKLQKVVMFIILALIILVAAFNIASTLIMMVMGKTGDIAILKTMGATDKSIRKIFVYKGMIIGGIGTLTGAMGGFFLCEIVKRFHFITLPNDVYFFSELPVSLEIPDVLIIMISTLAICFFSTLYPAHRAAKLNPVDALRYRG